MNVKQSNLICDTSFVGHLARRELRSRSYDDWNEAVLRRIQAASLSVSVVTIAVQRDSVDEWARLRVAARARGIALSDNDLWIAATASTCGSPLVTCDHDHQRIAAEMPVEVVYLAPPV
jgi:predicted nucleic acid-binding protein